MPAALRAAASSRIGLGVNSVKVGRWQIGYSDAGGGDAALTLALWRRQGTMEDQISLHQRRISFFGSLSAKAS